MAVPSLPLSRASSFRRVRSMPKRLRRSSTSVGRACARCGKAGGNTLRRRSPSSTTRRMMPRRPPTASRPRQLARRVPREQVAKWSGPELTSQSRIATDAARRLRSLGYSSGAAAKPGTPRPDPKDRIEIAAQLARVTSEEVTGDAAISTLESVLRIDPRNPQAHLRLGYAEAGRNRCDRAEPHFRAALAAGLPSADAGLGLAQCLLQKGNVAAATMRARSGVASRAGESCRRGEPRPDLACRRRDFPDRDHPASRGPPAPTPNCWKPASRWPAPWPTPAIGRRQPPRPRICSVNCLPGLPNEAKSSA